MPSLFLFKGNLKDHLSFAKHVIWSTVDFVLDLRLAASRILKDSVKYYCGVANWQDKASTETPEHALIKKVSKEEAIASDPFRVRLSFSLAEKLKMAIFGVFLVPIRFISAFLALNLAWALSCIGLLGVDNSNPVTGWRKQLQRVIHALGRFCCNCFGFQVSKTGTQVCLKKLLILYFLYFYPNQVSQSEAPVLIVAPHSTFFDAMAVFRTGLPFIVNREENRRIPFIGKCIEFAQVWTRSFIL